MVIEEKTMKLILQSYIQCKQSQDECDSPTKVSGASLCPSIVSAQGYNPMQIDPYVELMESQSFHVPPPLPPLHSFSFGFELAPNLSDNVIQAGRDLAVMAQEFSVSQPDRSILRFKEICMVTDPIEQIISIPVIRVQNLDKVTNVSWKTFDKTAISGTHYVGSNGEITFDKGDASKDIQIQILKSADTAKDLRFTVELNSDGMFAPKPMTVSLKKIENFDLAERSVLQSLPSFEMPFSVQDVKYALDSCLNARTFHMALTHLCSTTNRVDAQIALAAELSFLCFEKSCNNVLRGDSVIKVLSDFFRRDEYDF